MDWTLLIPGIVGAFVGVMGWLLVGLYIQRRQFARQAMTAARAVYFELDMNRVAIDVARRYHSFAPLGRGAFDRLLPEMAMLLPAEELRTVVGAYLSHAGYQQAATNDELPAAVRDQSLGAILGAHELALDVLGRRAFSASEARALRGGGESEPKAESTAATAGLERR